MQFLSTLELEALIAALHKTVQRALPITLVGAGLPQLPRLAGEAKSYAERLFEFPTIGRLSEPEATRALVEPAQALGVEYEAAAVSAVIDYTEGYPYFAQEYGNVLWDLTEEPPIRLEDTETARDAVEANLIPAPSGFGRSERPSSSFATCGRWPSSAPRHSGRRTSPRCSGEPQSNSGQPAPA